MNNTYSVYMVDSGLFTGVSIACPGHVLELNVPDGCSVILGEFDALSQRVDIGTGDVVDYVPPSPGENYQWSTVTRRWEYIETNEDIAALVRWNRDRLLAASDWVVMRASERGEPIDDEWKKYRQALRDLSMQSGFPRAVFWPTSPT